MIDIVDHRPPVMEQGDRNNQGNQPQSEYDLHLTQKMVDAGQHILRVLPRFAAPDFLLMRMLTRMTYRHEFAGHERMDNGAQKDQGSNQVERLLLDAMEEDRRYAL